MMTQFVMHVRLWKRHDQMGPNGDQAINRKLINQPRFYIHHDLFLLWKEWVNFQNTGLQECTRAAIFAHDWIAGRSNQQSTGRQSIHLCALFGFFNCPEIKRFCGTGIGSARSLWLFLLWFASLFISAFVVTFWHWFSFWKCFWIFELTGGSQISALVSTIILTRLRD